MTTVGNQNAVSGIGISELQSQAASIGRTPYYEDESVTIYHGDALELLPHLKADIVLTDPPYNAGKNYGKRTNDRQSWEEWCAWFDARLALMLAASRDGVLAFLSQTARRQYTRLGAHDIAWEAVWVKPLSMAACAAPFMPHWEPLCYWGDKRRRRGDGVGWGSDVLTHNVEFRTWRRNHPTPKPLSLMDDLVARFAPTDVILDPFMGSGTTLIAAKANGQRAIGIEIEEKNCETAARILSVGIVAAEAHERGQGALL